MSEHKIKELALDKAIEEVATSDVSAPTKIQKYDYGSIIAFPVGMTWVIGRLMPHATDDTEQLFLQIEHPVVLAPRQGGTQVFPFSLPFGDIPSSGIVSIREAALPCLLQASKVAADAWYQFKLKLTTGLVKPAPGEAEALARKSSIIMP